ncbi:MAG: amidohydrolase family protein [Candidatus Nanopelagicales bacterium]|jgi:imidazolonepropionase-like amidohydrolase
MTVASTTNQILFTNVNVFDGENETLIQAAHVLVEANVVKQISTSPITADDATVIDGAGRTLMPGIVESHAHLSLAAASVPELLTELPSYATILSVLQAELMLMNGVTTARDLGGEVFGLKRAIDGGLVPGPRLYPSGALISQTSGHADYRFPDQTNPGLCGPVPATDLKHYSVLVDGVPRMLAAAREQLRLGATQIKVCIGGGVASPTDPIDVTEFTTEEIAAAVACAENWGTYVTVHGYTVRAINQALDAGVKVIEHGQLLDEKTLQRMVDEGAWLSFQPFTHHHEDNLNDAQNAKQAIVADGTEGIYKLIKAMPDLKVTHGTDTYLNPPDGVKGDVKQMERLLKWFTPFEILKMATSNVGELVKLTGPRNPYPLDLGVVKEGAYADLLLVNGNPLEDLTMVTDNENLRVIMKDGKVYKNTL